MRNAVYVGQFGTVWKLRPGEWLDLCRAGAEGWAYDLSNYRELKHPPRWLVRDEEWRDCFWSPRADVLYVEPLDWGPDDFTEHLRDLSARPFGKP